MLGDVQHAVCEHTNPLFHGAAVVAIEKEGIMPLSDLHTMHVNSKPLSFPKQFLSTAQIKPNLIRLLQCLYWCGMLPSAENGSFHHKNSPDRQVFSSTSKVTVWNHLSATHTSYTWGITITDTSLCTTRDAFTFCAALLYDQVPQINT